MCFNITTNTHTLNMYMYVQACRLQYMYIQRQGLELVKHRGGGTRGLAGDGWQCLPNWKQTSLPGTNPWEQRWIILLLCQQDVLKSIHFQENQTEMAQFNLSTISSNKFDHQMNLLSSRIKVIKHAYQYQYITLTNITSVVRCPKNELGCSVVPWTDVGNVRFTLH